MKNNWKEEFIQNFGNRPRYRKELLGDRILHPADFLESSLSLVLKQEQERYKEKLETMRVEMICFCGALKDKYSCNGYCNCGAFIKNRRGYSDVEQGRMDGYNQALSDLLKEIID